MTTNEAEARPMPKDVHEAIRRVMEELPGIQKLTGQQHRERSGQAAADGERTVNYAYRGIEQITSEGQRLFGRYGVIFKPKVLSTAEREFTMGQRDTRWVDVSMRVMYYVVGPGGAETVIPIVRTQLHDGTVIEEPDESRWYMKGDFTIVGPVESVGRDNSDKGYNKALTQAFKQMLLQLLSIGDPKDEGEHERHEQEGFPNVRVISAEMAAAFRTKARNLPIDRQKQLAADMMAEGLPAPEQMSNEQYGRAEALLYEHVLALASEGTVKEAFTTPLTEEQAAIEAARAELSSIVLAVPHTGTKGRDILQSHLRGRFGPTTEISDLDTLEEAIAIASAWPDPPESQETAPAPPSAPETVGEVELPPPTPAEPTAAIPENTPARVVDDTVAEVKLMKAPELKDELRKRGLPVSGNVDALGQRLTVAMLNEWHEQGKATT